jgi:hypothetical protein
MGINGAMFIQTEQTPNPQTLKFLPGRVVMKEGTAFFQNMGESADSPLTPSKMKSLFAKGESADSPIFWKKAVPSFITTLPGKNFKV